MILTDYCCKQQSVIVFKVSFYFLFLLNITNVRNRIDYISFEKKLTPLGIFRLNDVLKLYPHFDSRRLNEWQKKGYITKLINGIYIFNSIKIDESILFQIANTLSNPSYVSLETALSYYQLIPEQSFTITSVRTIKSNIYETPKGSFWYRSIKPSLFFGYQIIPSKYRPISIADPEKSLLDLLYFRSDLDNEESIEAFRWNISRGLINWQKMDKYLQVFNSNALNKRVQIFKKVYHANLT